MNKENLSKKMNIILKELKMNRTEFINECKKVNPYISKPTILNLINGNSKGLPKIETIDTVVYVCRSSNNDKLIRISYDYLMNENIDNITREDIAVGKDLYLSDRSIERLKHSWKIADSHIISNFIDNVSSDFWEYQSYIKNICRLQRLDIEARNNLEKIKNENVNSLTNLYCDYKRRKLEKEKNTRSKEEYKKYLIKSFDYDDIYEKDFTIKELEENLIEMYRSFSTDIKDSFESFLEEGKTNNNHYTNSDMKDFMKYLKNEYKAINNNVIEKYYESIRIFSNSYTCAFLIEFLRNNFKSQSKFIKDKRKLYNKIVLYKNNGIKLPEEVLLETECFLKDFYDSIEIFNKYLRLLISETLIDYYNKIQSIEMN